MKKERKYTQGAWQEVDHRQMCSSKAGGSFLRGADRVSGGRVSRPGAAQGC